jgi:hypothetical protein
MKSLQIAAMVMVDCLIVAMGAASAQAPRSVAIDQNIDRATLQRYYHTDQGTRLLPAAFLEALKNADGNGRLMSTENYRKWGFIVDKAGPSKSNPYGWPLGFTVSDPKVSGGIRVAGVTCAFCHTGQIDYHGAVIRIEGGQSYIDVPAFQGAVFAAVHATASDPARTAAFVKDAVAAGYPVDRAVSDFSAVAANIAALLYGQKGLAASAAGPGRVDAVQGIANTVFAADLMVPSNAKDFDAPVSYPYLWDIWRLSWLQYNGFLPPQAISRNIGETLGVSARTNIVDPRTGVLNPESERWQTSVQLKNLIWMESVLEELKAPTWPAGVLGRIDSGKAVRGRELFVKNCAHCHEIRELPNGRWDVTVVPLTEIGTDPNQATNWGGRKYDASKLGLGSAVPATTLSVAVNAVRRQLYADNHTPPSQQEGDDTFEAPCGYKARPLIGVWATPPFLHNGSVRTVYDLLSDTRPASFKFGSREYDPVKLGYVEDGDAVLDTSISGNHDSGHWWTDDANRPGRIGPKLSENEKYALIEYLKAATYANYPKMKVAKEQPLPCGSDREWASHLSGKE